MLKVVYHCVDEIVFRKNRTPEAQSTIFENNF